MVPVSVAPVAEVEFADAAVLVDAVAQAAGVAALVDVVVLSLVHHLARPPLAQIADASAVQVSAERVLTVGLPELSQDHGSCALVVESRPLALPAAVVYPLVPLGPLVVPDERRVLPAPGASPFQLVVGSGAAAVAFAQREQPRVVPHSCLEIDQGHAFHLEVVLRAWR